MKKLAFFAVMVLSMVGGAQAQKSDAAMFESMEKAAWDAFGKGDGKHFQTFLSDDALVSTGSRFATKTEIVTDVSGKPCSIKSFSFSNFKVTMLNSTTALATYDAVQDGTCGTMAMPAKVLGSTVYVKRNGKWQGAFHTESPNM